MKAETLQDLFVGEIKDLYSAENEILKALPKMARGSSNPELKRLFTEHLEQTKGQVERLKQIFQQLKKTVLLVTHDMSEAAYVGDQIALMRDGQIVQLATFRELRDQPADPFVTEFIRAQRPLWPEETLA